MRIGGGVKTKNVTPPQKKKNVHLIKILMVLPEISLMFHLREYPLHFYKILILVEFSPILKKFFGVSPT